jgi:hypothetical protein
VLIKSKSIEEKAAKHHSTFAMSSNNPTPDISKQKHHPMPSFKFPSTAQQNEPIKSEKPTTYQSTQHYQLDQAQQPH